MLQAAVNLLSLNHQLHRLLVQPVLIGEGDGLILESGQETRRSSSNV